MRVSVYLLTGLVSLCSCRLIVDPGEFSPDTAAPGDAAPTGLCPSWEPVHFVPTGQPLGAFTLTSAENYRINPGTRELIRDEVPIAQLQSITQRNGADALLLEVESLVVEPDAALVLGTFGASVPPLPPLIIASYSTISIAEGAKLDVGSSAATESLGVGANADGCDDTSSGEMGTDGSGGGGGGYSRTGRRGGESGGVSGGVGGDGIGAPAGIRGGCSGGNGGHFDPGTDTGGSGGGGAGGGGGGAIFLAACDRIDIEGVVTAGGAAGAGGQSNIIAGGGGGGSGGYIGLEAPRVVIGPDAVLAANGGGGGGGSHFDTMAGARGRDGEAASVRAGGGDAGKVGDAGDGGAGGSILAGADGGEDGGANLGGGGGGGGVGFIFYVGPLPLINDEAVVSPAAEPMPVPGA